MNHKKIINRARVGHNLFITGEAGTGKTSLLKKILIHLWPREFAITALTGIAAVAIGGSTLHSFSGIGIGKDDIDKILHKIATKKYISRRWLQVETLVIDEISMCSAEIFEKIDKSRSILSKSRSSIRRRSINRIWRFLSTTPCLQGHQRHTLML